MTLMQLEKRLAALEQVVAQLQTKLNNAGEKAGPWWVTEAGRFANDPVFDEVVRLGREYRESQYPDYMKPKKKSKRKSRSNARS